MTFTQILHRKNVCQHGFLNISCSATMMVKLFFPLPKCMQTHISKSWLCNTVECFGIKRQTDGIKPLLGPNLSFLRSFNVVDDATNL